MDRSTLKQELEKVIGDSIETMNSKVQDGEENFEGDKNDIFPVALMRQEERARQRKMKIFLNGVGVAEIVMGVLALILNTIFIYDGMNSGWYQEPEAEGNGMKVVSIGEGIIAGEMISNKRFLSNKQNYFKEFSTCCWPLSPWACWQSLGARRRCSQCTF